AFSAGPTNAVKSIVAFPLKDSSLAISGANLWQDCRTCCKYGPCGILLIIVAVAGCQSSAKEGKDVSSFQAAYVDFSHQVEAEYAEGFRISYHHNYKLLEILKPCQDRVDTLRYSLVPRELVDKVQAPRTCEIPIPIRSLVATSTAHIGFIEM